MPRRKKPPYGLLDTYAAAMLSRDPRLTRAQIAKALGCNPKSLMNREKYPLLARVWDMNRAKQLDRRLDATFGDRWRNGQNMANPEGEYGLDWDYDDDE